MDEGGGREGLLFFLPIHIRIADEQKHSRFHLSWHSKLFFYLWIIESPLQLSTSTGPSILTKKQWKKSPTKQFTGTVCVQWASSTDDYWPYRCLSSTNRTTADNMDQVRVHLDETDSESLFWILLTMIGDLYDATLRVTEQEGAKLKNIGSLSKWINNYWSPSFYLYLIHAGKLWIKCTIDCLPRQVQMKLIIYR